MFLAALVLCFLASSLGDTDKVIHYIENATDIVVVSDVNDTSSIFVVNATKDGRSYEENVVDSRRFPCEEEMPCGWKSFFNLYWRQSPCDCPNNTECKFYETDESIISYVYRCQQVNLTSTTKPSEELSPTESSEN
ncbi:hypothetical protein CEXT_363071 [Caerostris extrusa]|uniref:Uncharacterized protein n=1 Tax=Caerostris extrusa TaxID=172846 RepID=A0AAV4NCX1_CAEEX|nr:hypothetical protein CEXT_363071 [Caerostris extrusa]